MFIKWLYARKISLFFHVLVRLHVCKIKSIIWASLIYFDRWNIEHLHKSTMGLFEEVTFQSDAKWRVCGKVFRDILHLWAGIVYSIFCCPQFLGPSIHGPVTDILVNICILGKRCRGWAVKNDVCCRLNNHISIISLHICDFSPKSNGSIYYL